ncbi:exosome complex exonuclease RRP46 homolog isoform X2 [Panicum hallii]|uniref:exosome complex exonuclease RRP46 homolog isoform X2 n=1 Tax=Panicum hallii TaxID=206008 RepID=UPI000DF4EA24|nr:exosome complex exonuclease RRP46 homolog isoform X2 [Panicum hallii]
MFSYHLLLGSTSTLSMQCSIQECPFGCTFGFLAAIKCDGSWNMNSIRVGRQERVYEMTLKRTLQSICMLTVHPNTTTSVVLQVVGDDGSLLPCAINASCAALAFAGIPLKHLAVAIGCGVVENGGVILDTNTAEEQQLKSFAHLVFPSSRKVVGSKEPKQKDVEFERGLITSISHGVMSEDDYLNCIERGVAASSRISDFMRKTLQKEAASVAA